VDEYAQREVDSLNTAVSHLYRQGQFDEAVTNAITASALIAQLWGADHPHYATSLNRLAQIYYTIENYAAAETLYQQALMIRRASLGETHPDYATSLNNLAELYRALGNYAAAEPLYHQALKIDRHALGEAHPDYATDLNNLALLYHTMGNYAAAEPLYHQALSIRYAALGETHPDYVISLNNLAELYRALGNYTAAEPFYRQIAEIDRQILGEAHPDYAASLNQLGRIYYAMGKYAAAEPLYHQALAIRHAALGETHPDYATSLNNLAGLYRMLGNYTEAGPLYHQALAIFRNIRGENHPDYATSLNNLAGLYLDMGNYAATKPLYEQALAIRRQALGEQHPDYATSLNNLAFLYRLLNNYTEAKPLYEQALAIRGQALGEQHPDYASSLNNMAELYRLLGDYATAEPFYRQAAEINRHVLGEDHPNYANDLNNMAFFYQAIGDYAAAEPLYHKALAIRKVALGENHPDYASSLGNLAILYKMLGNYAAAELLFQQTLEIDRRTFGEAHPDYATDLSNLAIVYWAQGNYAAAEPLCQQALSIRRMVFGPNHPDYATSLNNLALLYWARGDYAAAEPLYRQVVEIDRRALGENHPSYATDLNNLAALYAALGQVDEALLLMQKVAEIDNHTIAQIFSLGSDRQRRAAVQALQNRFHIYLSLILRSFTSTPAALQHALDTTMRRKGIAATALTIQRDAILSSRYPELTSQINSLTMLRTEIGELTFAGPESDSITTYRDRLACLTTQYERLEADLARHIPEIRGDEKLSSTIRLRVAQALPEGSILVEFIRVNMVNFTAVPACGDTVWEAAHYVAFVLLAQNPEDIHLYDLGEAEPIDRWIAEFRQTIHRTAEDASSTHEHPAPPLADITVSSDRPTLRDALTATMRSMRPFTENPATLNQAALGNKLRHALIDPLLPILGERTQLILAPDGDLSRLPFEVLPLDEKRYMIDAYHMSYLSAGRDALRFGAVARQAAEPLVIADPDFDLTNTTVSNSSPGVPFTRLEGTRREGEQVATLLRVTPLLDKKALEQTLKAHPSPYILHLATHGFFFPTPPPELSVDLQASLTPYDSGRLGHVTRASNPLLRSGLALAGANTWLQEGVLVPEAEDGLLTAFDVTGLDLLDTDLVVLSACETGLGTIQIGEGVFGLRRAFMLAGARTLVMSLWRVPDHATHELMVSFYQRVLAGVPRAQALREAQQALRVRYPDPLYWGAFICQGDPAPLPQPPCA
jgi:tetratricopeptide (TPR) repeat protein/CHAT domain-containing protein